MRPLTETLLFDDALKIVLGAAVPITRVETLALADADGRVVATDVTSAVDVPPFDRAAMDGYAVRAADTFGASVQAPNTLRCVARIFTGEVSSRHLGEGECIEIATGAPMPAGADAVVMVEDTDRHDDGVSILTPVYPKQHVGSRGADMRPGSIVSSAGDVLTPSRIGALAATGHTTISVFARPRIAILSTGNEIAEPGEPLGPGRIYDINRFTLNAIVGRHGGVGVPLPTTVDAIEDLSAAVDAAAGCDVIVFSGGSSVGDRDLLLDVLARRGEVLLHGIALKPGKPTVFGRIRGVPFFGMPGYPTSCLSNAYLLLVPMLRTIARLEPWRATTLDLPLTKRIVSTTGRHQFYTVRVVAGGAEPAFKASGDITSMAHADGYIEIPAQTDILEAGTVVRVKLFN